MKLSRRNHHSIDNPPSFMEEVRWLQAQKENLQLRPDNLPASQQRLMNRLRSEQARQVQLSNRRKWWPLGFASGPALAGRLVLLALILFSLAQFSFKLARSSRFALPGEGLYPVKIALEQAQLAVTFSPTQDARLYMKIAENRSTEIEALVMEERYEYLQATAIRLEKSVYQAYHLLPAVARQSPDEALVLMYKLDDVLATQKIILEVLIFYVPQQYQAGVEHALLVSERND